MTMNKFSTTLLFLSILVLSACSQGPQESSVSPAKTFRVGFPPDENPAEIIRKNAPLLEYLKKQTDVNEIEIVVPDTYTAAIEEMGRGNLDMVYFGGLTYVLAKKDLDVTPVARGVVDGTPDNFTFIVTRKDSGITSLQDLKGRTFAFGDVASTSGHLIPHQALLNKGIDPNKDFKKLEYTGAHDKTAFAVFEGKVDAGAMNARLFPILVEKGLIKKDEMIVLWKSEPFADYPWAVRSNVGADTIRQLTDAFVNLKDPQMLALLGVEGYEATTDADFRNIREAAINLGFMGD